jgi:uncharacterized membrane protein
MSVEDAAKLVISAGLVNPKYPEILADDIVDPAQLERVRSSEDA